MDNSGYHVSGPRVLACRRGSEVSKREALEFSKYCSLVVLPKQMAAESEYYASLNLEVMRKWFIDWGRRARQRVKLRRCLGMYGKSKAASAVAVWKAWGEAVNQIRFRFVVKPSFGLWRASVQLALNRRSKSLRRALPLTRLSLLRRSFLNWLVAVKSAQRQLEFALQGIAKRHWYTLECKRRFARWKQYLYLQKSCLKKAISWKQAKERRNLGTYFEAIKSFADEKMRTGRIVTRTFNAWRRVCLVNINSERLSWCLQRLRLYASMIKTLRRVFTRLHDATRMYYVSDSSSPSLCSDVNSYYEEDAESKALGAHTLDLSMAVFREDFLRNATRHRKWREQRLLNGDGYDNEDIYDFEYASTDVNESRRVLLNHELKRQALKNLRKSNSALREMAFATGHENLLNHMNAVYRFDTVLPLSKPTQATTWDNLQTRGYAKHVALVERLASHRVAEHASQRDSNSRHE